MRFMSFKQGGKTIAVNMALVAYIHPADYADKSVFYFIGSIKDEPLYLIVDETLEQIGARAEWSQK